MVERKDRFESKQTFTTRAFAEWNSSSDAEREQFLNALATAAYKMSIKNIFCSNKIPKSSADIVPLSTVTASTSNDRPLQIDLCENVHSVVTTEESFCNQKSLFC